MSAHLRPRLSRQAAELLLAARHASIGSGSRTATGGEQTAAGSLAWLLAAAAAPSGERELSGETNAVVAFRAAHLVPATKPTWRQSMSVTKLLAVKVLLTATGVTAGGGVALAAATGHLPAALGGQSPASPSATAAPGTSATHPAASPSPNLKGLCTAYTKGVADSPGKALDNPAFSALITAAGGKSDVAAFCATLPANVTPGHTQTARPAGKPTALPTAHPTPSHPTPTNVMPSTPGHPTGAPTSAPTGHSHP